MVTLSSSRAWALMPFPCFGNENGTGRMLSGSKRQNVQSPVWEVYETSLPTIPWNYKDSSMALLVMLGLLSVFAPFLRGCAPQVVDSPSEAGRVWPLAFHRLCARQACLRVHWSQEHGDVREVGFGDAVSAFSTHSSVVTRLHLPVSPFPDTWNSVGWARVGLCPQNLCSEGQGEEKKRTDK